MMLHHPTNLFENIPRGIAKIERTNQRKNIHKNTDNEQKKLTIDKKKNNLHGSSIKKRFRRRFHRIRSFHRKITNHFRGTRESAPQTFLIKVEIFSLPPPPSPLALDEFCNQKLIKKAKTCMKHW